MKPVSHGSGLEDKNPSVHQGARLQCCRQGTLHGIKAEEEAVGRLFPVLFSLKTIFR